MWVLKIAEGKGPYLYSTNKFVGRQFWEFNPDAGTLEEKEQVEKARQGFWNSRRNGGFHACSDLLVQMQLIKESKMDLTSIPPIRLKGDEQVNLEVVTTTIIKAVRLHRAIQAKDGHWPAENAGPMFFTPPLNDDGGWGFYIDGRSTMIGSALAYVALRILGERKDDGDGAIARARKWILDHGGATSIPSWGKVYLSVLGVYEWEGCNPLPPEFWLFPKAFPFHPAEMWCYCRTTYMPMSYLYGKRIQGPITHLVLSLREEIHGNLFDDINWNEQRNNCCKSLQMMCWWAENPNGDEWKCHLARVPDYLWIAEDGMTMHSFGSQLWDCALGTQAIIASNMVEEYGDCLRKAHYYIRESQVKDNPSGDFGQKCRHFTKGSWTFSDQDHGWTVSDCTAEALKVERDLMPLQKAAKLLINAQMDNGEFPQQEIGGVYMKNCLLFYALHRNIFPLWALGEYRNRVWQHKKS
ncbi:hypothetical protein SSX86_022818 [Deinandra increscens subsp. villosa]|uniref:Squalene cyclase N-terminal domain-containing protein n=1 Tax=Deinandra increscens subsp. villosa TaxID=3103831 RepID=A0AAP0CNX1_9ASTR